MELVNVHDSYSYAALVETLPSDPEGLQELVAVLMGLEPEYSSVLQSVVPGSVPDEMKAEQYIYLVFKTLPTGGIYGVINWVNQHLDPAMPEGWGAAITQPAMIPLMRSTSHDDLFYKGSTGDEVRKAYMVVLSPMEQVKTGHVTHVAI